MRSAEIPIVPDSKRVVRAVAMHVPAANGKRCRPSKDGVLCCVNPFHLDWGFPAENVADSYKKQRRGK